MSIGPPQETYCNKMWYLDLKNFNWHLCKVTGDIPSGRRSSSSCKLYYQYFISGLLIINVSKQRPFPNCA